MSHGGGSLTNPEAQMTPKQLKEYKAHQAEQLEAKRQKEIRAKERKAERALIRNCDHVLKDVTEERRKLIKKRGLPSRVKRPLELWKKNLKYEKCTSCGLLKISSVIG